MKKYKLNNYKNMISQDYIFLLGGTYLYNNMIGVCLAEFLLQNY